MTRVLIADDHPVFRAGLAALLASEPELVVVGEAATGPDAVAQAAALAPDVLVLDLDMPGPGAVATITQVVAAAPGTRVLVLTMHDDDRHVFDVVRAGALGYVLKGADPDAVLRAVEAVARGEGVFGADLARRMGEWFAASPPNDPLAGLTPREQDVVRLLADGLGNAAIAARLGISLKTVRNVVSSVLAKLQLPDRAAAREHARRAVAGPPPVVPPSAPR